MCLLHLGTIEKLDRYVSHIVWCWFMLYVHSIRDITPSPRSGGGSGCGISGAPMERLQSIQCWSMHMEYHQNTSKRIKTHQNHESESRSCMENNGYCSTWSKPYERMNEEFLYLDYSLGWENLLRNYGLRLDTLPIRDAWAIGSIGFVWSVDIQDVKTNQHGSMRERRSLWTNYQGGGSVVINLHYLHSCFM